MERKLTLQQKTDIAFNRRVNDAPLGTLKRYERMLDRRLQQPNLSGDDITELSLNLSRVLTLVNIKQQGHQR